MRIIYLNTWYANVGEAFWNFIKEYKNSTDIFCFQEVKPEEFKKLSGILNEHNGFFESAGFVKEMNMSLGQTILAGKNLKIFSSGRVFTFRKVGDDVGFLQYVGFNLSGKTVLIGNIHGKAYPGEKLDTKIRLKQSERILNFFENKPGPKIIGGDFNLMPGTKSVRMFENAGFRNLIKEFKVKSTRNELTWNRFKDEKGFVRQYFSDYVFTSPEVKVKAFAVPDVKVSDHLPLILDFEV